MPYSELIRKFVIGGHSIRLLIDVNDEDFSQQEAEERADDIVFAMNAIITPEHSMEQIASIAVGMFTHVTVAEVADENGNGVFASG